MNEPVKNEKAGNGFNAKGASLASMVVSAVWIGSLSVLKALWGLFAEKEFGLTMNEIVLSGLMLAAVFSPVYLSIVLDKIRDIKIGGQ